MGYLVYTLTVIYYKQLPTGTDVLKDVLEEMVEVNDLRPLGLALGLHAPTQDMIERI